jgi:hypothetical protein
MVHNDGPQCADTTAVAAREVIAGQRFLIGDASLAWNPSSHQRFQGASAIAISDEDAARLIKEHFPRLQASELKYRSLSRRPGNHQRLPSLQRDILTHHKSVTYVCDKRFLLVLMFVDYAVEPFYYERGIDFYENGQNYAMASMLTTAAPKLLWQAAFDNLLVAFQHAAKEKSPEALKALVAAARGTRWQEFPESPGPPPNMQRRSASRQSRRPA